MKCTSTFIFLVIFMIGRSALGQDVFSPFYVVIGGFKQEENAQRYCVYADEQNLPAVYAYNKERQIYYVYVRATQNKEVAYDILKKLKQSSVFKDSWVFNGSLSGDNGIIARNSPPKAEPKADPQPEVVIAEPVVEKPDETSSVSTPVEETPPSEMPKPVGKPFYFKLVNGQTGDEVKGIIRLQENERATHFRGFKGNERVYVPAPVNRSGKWIVVGQALGFRLSKKSLVYAKADQLAGASVGDDQEVIIPLELDPVRKGDYIEMEGVKFFHNAALLTPGSEMELDQLVALMNDNPGYQVRLHGHTNGAEDRDAVTIGTSTDFFNPNVSNQKVHVSAKDLSLMRAELVKAYLVSKGIEGSRITTKGEGGKQMIFDPRGTLAGLNDRVEVEIRKH
ncbi:MAG TPA: OmpA family protein [Chryseosolibacter sp.]|nr:OmpA family protein [Chryseosolibacter sp.]